MIPFPEKFVWGAAAAAYQIEGAAFEDGRGLSVWDMLCRQPGKVWRGHAGDVACDHYHRFRDDVGLMRRIGLQAYRLSVSWPRVLPEGVGAVNARGLDFYDQLVDKLLSQGIDPWVTLFHWDFPYDLFLRGSFSPTPSTSLRRISWPAGATPSPARPSLAVSPAAVNPRKPLPFFTMDASSPAASPWASAAI